MPQVFTIFRSRIMLRAIYCLWYVVELNLINLLLLQASLIYTSVDSTSRRKEVFHRPCSCLPYLHPREEGCFTKAVRLRMLMLPCQQVCLPRAFSTASIPLLWLRQPQRGCFPHTTSPLWGRQAGRQARQGLRSRACSTAVLSVCVCYHGAAPLHRCHVCARCDVSCSPSILLLPERGMQGSLPPHQPRPAAGKGNTHGLTAALADGGQ